MSEGECPSLDSIIYTTAADAGDAQLAPPDTPEYTAIDSHLHVIWVRFYLCTFLVTSLKTSYSEAWGLDYHGNDRAQAPSIRKYYTNWLSCGVVWSSRRTIARGYSGPVCAVWQPLYLYELSLSPYIISFACCSTCALQYRDV